MATFMFTLKANHEPNSRSFLMENNICFDYTIQQFINVMNIDIKPLKLRYHDADEKLIKLQKARENVSKIRVENVSISIFFLSFLIEF